MNPAYQNPRHNRMCEIAFVLSLILLFVAIGLCHSQTVKPDSIVTSSKRFPVPKTIPVTVMADSVVVTRDIYHFLSATTPPVIPPTLLKEIHGLYIDDANLRIGTQDENVMVALAQRDGFNYYIFYAAIDMVSSSKRATTAKGIRRLRLAGVKDIAASKHPDANFNLTFDDIRAYNQWCLSVLKDTLAIFNVLNTEFEHWNKADKVWGMNMASQYCKTMQSYIGKDGFTRSEYYNGHAKDPVKQRFYSLFTDSTSNWLLHMYTASPLSEYAIDRVTGIDTYAGATGKKPPYVELTSAEDPFFGNEYAEWGVGSVRNVRRALFKKRNFKNVEWAGDVIFDFQYYILRRPVMILARMAKPTPEMLLPVSGILPPEDGVTEQSLRIANDTISTTVKVPVLTPSRSTPADIKRN